MRYGNRRGSCRGPRGCGTGPMGPSFRRGMHRMHLQTHEPTPDEEKEFLRAELKMLDADRKAIEARLSELG